MYLISCNLNFLRRYYNSFTFFCSVFLQDIEPLLNELEPFKNQSETKSNDLSEGNTQGTLLHFYCSDLDVFKIMSEFCLYTDTSNSCLEIFLTFIELCIARCVFYITNEMQLIQCSSLLSALYMFRAVFPPIIRSL
jgi:hypothetical protein